MKKLVVLVLMTISFNTVYSTENVTDYKYESSVHSGDRENIPSVQLPKVLVPSAWHNNATCLTQLCHNVGTTVTSRWQLYELSVNVFS